MTLLKHPTAGTIIDVTGPRATVLKARGYTEATEEDLAPAADAPSAVQPQPPIDTRKNPPEEPTDTRPEEEIADDPLDMRPPNPLGPVSESVEEADGAGLDDDEDDVEPSDEPPAKSATRGEWDEYAASIGIDPEQYSSKDDLIAAVEAG